MTKSMTMAIATDTVTNKTITEGYCWIETFVKIIFSLEYKCKNIDKIFTDKAEGLKSTNCDMSDNK